MKPNVGHCFEYFKRSLSNKFSSLKQILFVVMGASWVSSALLCGVACLSSPWYSEERIKIVCIFPVLFSLFCYHMKYPVIFMYIHWRPKVKEGHFNLSFKADTQKVFEKLVMNYEHLQWVIYKVFSATKSCEMQFHNCITLLWYHCWSQNSLGKTLT